MTTRPIVGLLALFCLLCGACMNFGIESEDITIEKLARFARVIGDAAIRVEVTKVVKERAPQLMQVLDVPTVVKVEGQPDQVLPPDGQISLDELLVFDPTNPVDLATIYAIVRELVDRRR